MANTGEGEPWGQNKEHIYPEAMSSFSCSGSDFSLPYVCSFQIQTLAENRLQEEFPDGEIVVVVTVAR